MVKVYTSLLLNPDEILPSVGFECHVESLPFCLLVSYIVKPSGSQEALRGECMSQFLSKRDILFI